jgi:hypothetical protein
MACGLHARIQASSGKHTKFQEDYYQKHTKPPHNDPYLRLQILVSAHYKKDDLLNSWIGSSDISGYHTDFYERHDTVGAGQGNGMVCVNKRMAGNGNGMGTACYV